MLIYAVVRRSRLVQFNISPFIGAAEVVLYTSLQGQERRMIRGLPSTVLVHVRIYLVSTLSTLNIEGM